MIIGAQIVERIRTFISNKSINVITSRVEYIEDNETRLKCWRREKTMRLYKDFIDINTPLQCEKELGLLQCEKNLGLL